MRGRRRAAGTGTRLTDDAADQLRPAIWGDTIVWEDRRHGGPNPGDVYMYDISEDKETRLTQGLGSIREPDVCGDIIVWVDDRDGDYEVMMYDRSTGTETKVTNDTSPQNEVVIYRDTIVWDDTTPGAGPGGPSDIHRYDIPTDAANRVTGDAAAWQRDPDIHGLRFAWSDNRHDIGGNDDIYLFDLVASEEERLTDTAADRQDPAVWGNLVVWEEGPAPAQNKAGSRRWVVRPW